MVNYEELLLGFYNLKKNAVLLELVSFCCRSNEVLLTLLMDYA